MFRSLLSAQRVATRQRAVVARNMQRRTMAQAQKLPPNRVADEANLSLNWLQDAGTYPIIVVIGFAMCVMVFEWGHALNAPDVHIGKGDRNTLDYVENDRSPESAKAWASHRGDSHFK